MTGLFLSILGGFLFLLKLLGLLLLGCILLILFLLILILVVPIRYKGWVSYQKKFQAKGEISWLLRCIVIKAEYREGVEAIGKVLWFKKFFQISREEEETASIKSSVGDGLPKSEVKQAPPLNNSLRKRGKRKRAVSPSKEKRRTLKDNQKRKESSSFRERAKGGEDNGSEKLPSPFHKMLDRGKEIWKAVANQENQACVFFLLEKLRSLLAHLLPRKIQGRLKFGFEDPSTTGQILGYLAVFYGIYQNSFAIIPVFDEKVLEVELDFKGRVRLLYIVYLAARVFFNRNCRRVYQRMRRRNPASP